MKDFNLEKRQKFLLFSLIIGIPVSILIFIQEKLSTFLPVISFKGIPFTLSFLQLIMMAILLTFLFLVFINKVMHTENLKLSKPMISITSFLTIVVIYLTTLSGYWNCFTFVPDSAGWLADPAFHTTIRPGVMRWFYELFLTKEEIAFNFYEDPALVYNTLICNEDHPFQDVVQAQIALYFLSLLFLTIALVKFLRWKHAILFALVVTSGYQGTGAYTNNAFDSISHVLIGVIVGNDLFNLYQNIAAKKFSNTLKNYSAFIALFITFIIPLGYFSFLAPEINSVQSEAIVYSLINAMIATAFLLPGRTLHLLPIAFLGLIFAGIALVSRLATLGTVVLFLIYFLIVIWKKTNSVKLLSLGLIFAFLPTILINQSSYKPEASMSFWGPVAYSLYVIDIDGADVALTEDERMFSEKAIELVDSHFSKALIEPKSIQPVWLSLGAYLYYGAIPAYQELETQFSQDYEMNDFFKNFIIKVFLSSPLDFTSKWIQNLQISLGFYNSSLYPPLSDSTSKVLYGPFVLLFLLFLIWNTSKIAPKSKFAIFVIASTVFFLGVLIASIFDGPSIRNVGINDIYLVPLILFGYSTALNTIVSKSGTSRLD
jgi:hypothetical protein